MSADQVADFLFKVYWRLHNSWSQILRTQLFLLSLLNQVFGTAFVWLQLWHRLLLLLAFFWLQLLFLVVRFELHKTFARTYSLVAIMSVTHTFYQRLNWFLLDLRGRVDHFLECIYLPGRLSVDCLNLRLIKLSLCKKLLFHLDWVLVYLILG